jgi:hypothetical protein
MTPVNELTERLRFSVMTDVKRRPANWNVKPLMLTGNLRRHMATQGLTRFYVSGDRQ